MGDLAPAHFPHCAWFHLPGPTPALALLYRAFTPPVLCALGPPQALSTLLDEVPPEPELYLHVRPEHLPALNARYRVLAPQFMWRMLLGQPAPCPPPPPGLVRLASADLEALQALYADGQASGESPDFFSPAMLEEGVYFGLRQEGALVAAAGTHLVVPQEGVAAIGNVYTRRDRRGHGLGGAVTGAVAAELVGRGVRTVALNVNQGNAVALRVYERLGFARYCAFVEGLAVRRGVEPNEGSS
jgi:ribosomal protein S18 acetylase RimI-like enzyme